MADAGDLQHAYLPIAEHGLVGDLHTVALVGTTGTIDWYCCPAFDSPSVFGCILDADAGGFYALRPEGDDWSSKQLYFPDTNILITRFFTPGGVGEVQDFMPIEPVGTAMHRHRLIRRVVVVRGEMRFVIEVQPRFDYGQAEHDVEMHPHGVVFRSPVLTLALEGAIAKAMGSERRLERRDGGVRATFDLAAGQSQTFVLERVPEDHICRPYPEHETAATFDATVNYWRRWVSQSRYKGRWREMLQRSALTLKLLTYAPTGALVAAPTTSLPEQLGGERNWDYRYTWIRDAAFSLYGLLRLGFSEEAAAFMAWLTDRFRESAGRGDGPLQIMYGVDGRADLEEEILDQFEGYAGSAPVRIGNGAAEQLQLDIYGELIDSVYLYNKYGEPISYDAWMDLVKVLEWLCENWDRADEGIWETRGGRRDFTYGRLMSWVAFDRALRLADANPYPAPVEAWRAH
ncbi:MAG TPA: glycoside hydrolase family 15 protein, partial [Solirubrobacteraceae bacterium]